MFALGYSFPLAIVRWVLKTLLSVHSMRYLRIIAESTEAACSEETEYQANPTCPSTSPLDFWIWGISHD